jgi:hypothetical protein
MGAFAPGQHVQTPLGKGVVLEVRNRRLLVRVQARDVLLSANDIRPIGTAASPPRAAGTRTPAAGGRATADRLPVPRYHDREAKAREGDGGTRVLTIDVHGSTVEQALDAVDDALNEALLGNASELRVIHGRSSSRIRDALHRHLRTLSVVRKARLDSANAGVTIIVL